ncbi:MAG: hypothetical protein U0X73_07045 [Thermoanaerobaculia bacterium]
MNGRVAVTGALAGLAVFLWSSLAHMVLPIGDLGVSQLPGEAAVLATLSENVQQPGLYVFPVEKDPAKWEQAYRDHPHGVLALVPAGGPLDFGRRLAVELATDVLCGWLAAFLFVAALPVFGNWKTGALAGATLGAFASLSIDFSYWNWYDFPTTYLAGQLIDQAVGWAIGGLILGWRLGRR